MNTAERFIAGEDRLSAVLRAAPLFDAPAHMAAWMHRAAHAIEDERRAGREADGGVCVFEPPARLHDAVLQEAQALERAQEPRRQALRAALAREAGVEEVLGAPVAAETEAWLRETWARQTPRNAARPPSTSRRVWWKPGLAFGASFTVALLTGLAAHHYWPAPPIPAAVEDMVAINANNAPGASTRQTRMAAAPSVPDLAAAPVARPDNAVQQGDMTNAHIAEAIIARGMPSDEHIAEHALPYAAPGAPQGEALPRPSKPVDGRPRAAIDAHAATQPPQPESSPKIQQQMASTAAPVMEAPSPSAQMLALRAAESASVLSMRDKELARLQIKAESAPAMAHRSAAPPELVLSAPASPPPPVTAAKLIEASPPAQPAFAPPVVAYLWPVDSEQWQQLAATLARNETAPTGMNPSSKSGNAPRQQWRLLVRAPDAPGVHALAALLRKSLPLDAELSVQPDPGIPEGLANLVPPHQ